MSVSVLPISTIKTRLTDLLADLITIDNEIIIDNVRLHLQRYT